MISPPNIDDSGALVFSQGPCLLWELLSSRDLDESGRKPYIRFDTNMAETELCHYFKGN